MSKNNFTLALSGAGLVLMLGACSEPKPEQNPDNSLKAKRNQSSMAAIQALESAEELGQDLEALEQQRNKRMQELGL